MNMNIKYMVKSEDTEQMRVISEKQKQMLRALADMNHYCCVCYGAEETIKVLKEYLLLRHMNTEMQADNLSIRIAGKLKQIFT